MIKNVRYLNPFPGRSAPLHLSGLFLFSPDVAMKLLGQPIRKTFQEQGKESLYKRLQQLDPSDEDAARRLIPELGELLQGSPLQAAFEAAINTTEGRERWCRMGDWEAALLGSWGENEEEIPAHGRFILAIERACQVPFTQIGQGLIQEATATLIADPLMRHFMWPQAVDALNRVQEPRALLPLRVAVALEIRLSALALYEVSCQKDDNHPSLFAPLVPTNSAPWHSPLQRWFAWLKESIGATSILAMLVATEDRDEINETTLKRWSSGQSIPTAECVRTLAQHHFQDVSYPPLWQRYEAAKEMNFIGFYANMVRKQAVEAAGNPSDSGWAPWPRLPYDHDSIESWMTERYPQWLKFHRQVPTYLLSEWSVPGH